MSYWVYVHTCPNGKKYVGVSTLQNASKLYLNKGINIIKLD